MWSLPVRLPKGQKQPGQKQPGRMPVSRRLQANWL
ncbi:MAG: hypothetical protein K0Q84_29, partial [Arthrobacter sp.]|nr:hypothetical protein [Arthrobacter sp.]